MGEEELVQAAAEATGLPKATIRKVLHALTDAIIAEVREGAQVKLIGFGVFHPYDYPDREGPHPQTGKPMRLKGRRGMLFRTTRGAVKYLNRR